MALELKIKLESWNQACDTITFSDINYTLDTALQYGEGANPARASLALRLYLKKVKYDYTESTITVGAGEVTTIDEWVVTGIAQDGWYIATVIGVINWVDSYSFAEDEITYRGGNFYKALSANDDTDPATNADVWQLVTDINDEIDNATVYSYELNEIVTCRIEKFLNNVVSEAGVECCDGCADSKKKSLAMDMDFQYNSILANLYNTDYAKADKICEYVSKYISTNCKTC